MTVATFASDTVKLNQGQVEELSCLASQDAQEVKLVRESLRAELTDVTLLSERYLLTLIGSQIYN